MFNHLKRYSSFALCVLLLNITFFFPSHLTATQEIPSQDETTQSAENVAENNEQSDEQQIKKPTFVESWQKVITLRWKELSKADVWNISAPLAGVTVLGVLYYYWPRNGNVDNNPGNDDPKPNPDNPVFLADLNENLPPEVQSNIAIQRIGEFFVVPKETSIDSDDADILRTAKEELPKSVLETIPEASNYADFDGTRYEGLAAKIFNDKLIVLSTPDNVVRIWNVHTKKLLCTILDNKEKCNGYPKLKFIFSAAISGDKVITGSSDGTAKVWDINTGNYLYTLVNNGLYPTCFISCVVTHENKVVTGTHYGINNAIHRPSRIQVWDVNTRELLYTFTEYRIRINSIAINDNRIVIESSHRFDSHKKIKIWPLSINLQVPELKTFACMEHTLTIPQADFIARAYNAMVAGQDFIIALPNDFNKIEENELQEQTDGRIYFTFPAEVREYLLSRLLIRK